MAIKVDGISIDVARRAFELMRKSELRAAKNAPNKLIAELHQKDADELGRITITETK